MVCTVRHFADNKALREFLGEFYGLVFRGFSDDDALMLAEAGMTITNRNIPVIHYGENDSHQMFLIKLLTNADIRHVITPVSFQVCLSDEIMSVVSSDNQKFVTAILPHLCKLAK